MGTLAVLFYLCAASLPDRMSHRPPPKFEAAGSEEFQHTLCLQLTSWERAADGSDTYADCQQLNISYSPNETSLSNPGQLTFPKPFARPLVNLFIGQIEIIDGAEIKSQFQRDHR